MMTSHPDYDRHLEAQNEARACDNDAYADWCEEQGYDPADDHNDEWETYKADYADDLAAERWEDQMRERMEFMDLYGDD